MGKKVLSGTLKAAYTVEAAVVFSICIILTGSLILLAYEVYRESTKEVSVEIKERDMVGAFRLADASMDLAGRIQKEGKGDPQ